MDYLVGLLFSILGSVISGTFGMLAWNMCIPVIFEGAPKITIVQSIIIAMVMNIMTYEGTLPEDKTRTESYALTYFVRLCMRLVGLSVELGILWIFMQIAY